MDSGLKIAGTTVVADTSRNDEDPPGREGFPALVVRGSGTRGRGQDALAPGKADLEFEGRMPSLPGKRILNAKQLR